MKLYEYDGLDHWARHNPEDFAVLVSTILDEHGDEHGGSIHYEELDVLLHDWWIEQLMLSMEQDGLVKQDALSGRWTVTEAGRKARRKAGATRHG